MTRILDGIGPGPVGQAGASSGALQSTTTGSTNSLVAKGDRIGGILEITGRAGNHNAKGMSVESG